MIVRHVRFVMDNVSCQKILHRQHKSHSCRTRQRRGNWRVKIIVVPYDWMPPVRLARYNGLSITRRVYESCGTTTSSTILSKYFSNNSKYTCIKFFFWSRQPRYVSLYIFRPTPNRLKKLSPRATRNARRFRIVNRLRRPTVRWKVFCSGRFTFACNCTISYDHETVICRTFTAGPDIRAAAWQDKFFWTVERVRVVRRKKRLFEPRCVVLIITVFATRRLVI